MKTANSLKSWPFLILGFLILVKVVFLFSGIYAIKNLQFSSRSYDVNFHYPKNEGKYSAVLKTWDAQHYLYLAEFGYNPDQESNRFFPLYPTSIKVLSLVTGDRLVSAYLISNIFSIGVAILLFRLALKVLKKQNLSFLTVVLFFSFPTAFYFSVVYSESLFLFLVLLFFYFMENKKYLYAALPLFLLPLARPTGIMIILPLIAYLVFDKNLWRDLSIPTFNKDIKIKFCPTLLLLLFPLAGLFVYFWYMNLRLGDPFSGLLGQTYAAGWDIRNLIDPISFVKDLFASDLKLHGFRNSLMDRAFFVVFFLCAPLVYKKLPKPFFVYYLSLVFVPLLGSFMSYTRYLAPCFPLSIALIAYLGTKHKIVIYLICVILFTIQMTLFVSYILNYWIA